MAYVQNLSWHMVLWDDAEKVLPNVRVFETVESANRFALSQLLRGAINVTHQVHPRLPGPGLLLENGRPVLPRSKFVKSRIPK